MRFFVSPYEAWMYKYLREVDPEAAQEDPEDPQEGLRPEAGHHGPQGRSIGLGGRAGCVDPVDDCSHDLGPMGCLLQAGLL